MNIINSIEKLTIRDRLHKRAESGAISAEYKLYPSQERSLLKDGFTVQRLYKITDPQYLGQHKCRIGWRYVASPDCLAHELLMLAAEQNASLRKQLICPEEVPCEHPYQSGGWT